MRAFRKTIAVTLWMTCSTLANAGSLVPGVYENANPGVHLLTVVEAEAGNKVNYYAHAPFIPDFCAIMNININYDVPANYDMTSPIVGTGTCSYEACSHGTPNCTVSPQAATEIFKQVNNDLINVTFVSSNSMAAFTRKKFAPSASSTKSDVTVSDITPGKIMSDER